MVTSEEWEVGKRVAGPCECLEGWEEAPPGPAEDSRAHVAQALLAAELDSLPSRVTLPMC